MTGRELKQACVDSWNKEVGSLTGYDCPKCKNKGYIGYLDDDGNEHAKECECMKIRHYRALAQNSGLGETLKLYTLQRYMHDEPWQDYIYNKAIQFIGDKKAHCFYIGGQSGSGKTHICTAIVREFIKQYKDVQYVVWNDVVTVLKQDIIGDVENYNSTIDRLKKATVLFIDDFFKTAPTAADLDKAFQIINYRYNISRAESEKRYITIISSERLLNELTEIDAAIAGRIAELSNNTYIIGVQGGKNKDMRRK